MTALSIYARRAITGIAAMSMTTFMIAAYFHLPATFAVQGMVA
jgi:hypothetical protein